MNFYTYKVVLKLNLFLNFHTSLVLNLFKFFMLAFKFKKKEFGTIIKVQV
jgi:hypothetical protein